MNKEQYRRMVEAKLRRTLLEQCKGYCMKCGQLPDWRGLSLSHTKPKGMGGTNYQYGLADVELLCGKCHSVQHGIREA